MKFEVELISDERCLVKHGLESPLAVVPDAMLAGFMRTACNGGAPAKAKRSYPKGTRKRKAKAETTAETTTV